MAWSKLREFRDKEIGQVEKFKEDLVDNKGLIDGSPIQTQKAFNNLTLKTDELCDTLHEVPIAGHGTHAIQHHYNDIFYRLSDMNVEIDSLISLLS